MGYGDPVTMEDYWWQRAEAAEATIVELQKDGAKDFARKAAEKIRRVMDYTDAEARQALQADVRAMPNGSERPGEHWNARLLRETAIRSDIAARYFTDETKGM